MTILSSTIIPMLEIKNNGFLTLDSQNLIKNVPRKPGVFILAMQLPNGVHKSYYISKTNDLYHSLRNIINGYWHDLPFLTQSLLEKFQPYFTFYIIPEPEYREEIEKMLANTNDPVTNLTFLEYC